METWDRFWYGLGALGRDGGWVTVAMMVATAALALWWFWRYRNRLG